jgi:hypothetical protein
MREIFALREAPFSPRFCILLVAFLVDKSANKTGCLYQRFDPPMVISQYFDAGDRKRALMDKVVDQKRRRLDSYRLR